MICHTRVILIAVLAMLDFPVIAAPAGKNGKGTLMEMKKDFEMNLEMNANDLERNNTADDKVTHTISALLPRLASNPLASTLPPPPLRLRPLASTLSPQPSRLNPLARTFGLRVGLPLS